MASQEKQTWEYSPALKSLINSMSFPKSKPMILGSYRLKSNVYPGDIDLLQNVQVRSEEKIVTFFQNMIKTLLVGKGVYIGDIKIGELSETQTREAYGDHYDESERQNILRWTPDEILLGEKQLPNMSISLKTAIFSGFFKMDVVAWIDSVYKDITIIYDMRGSDNKRINHFNVKHVETLTQNINKFEKEHDYFKMLKRVLSLLRYRLKYYKRLDVSKIHSYNILETLILNILNGELGRLYTIVIDLQVLLWMVEHTQKYSYI